MTQVFSRFSSGVLSAFVVALAAIPMSASAASPSEIPLGTTPQQLAVADLNRDGIPDMVVGIAGGIVVLLGHGDGTFGAEQMYLPKGGIGNAVAIGDFNGDGKLDVVTGGGLLIGNGDGTFQRFGPSFGLANVYGAVSGDLNGDGKLDVVLSGIGQTFILLGDGGGTFQAGATYPYGMFRARLADLNRDGRLDLVVPDSSSGTVVMLGNGDGTFSTPITRFSSGNDAVVGDLNGDGIPDIVAAGNGCLNYALGHGDGTFAGGGSCAGEGFPLALGDLDSDGHLDVFAGSGSATEWRHGNGDGTFGPATAVTVGTLNAGHDVAIADLNRDGYQDVILTNQANNSVSVLLGPVGTPTPGSAGVSPASLGFAALPAWQTSPAQTVTLTSNGPGALIISGLSIDSGGFNLTTDCPIKAPLAAGLSCTLSLVFAPTDRGLYRATLNILDSDPSGSQAVSLSGSGLINPTSIAVDSVTTAVGTPANFRAVVTSNGQPPVVGGQVLFHLPNGSSFSSGVGGDGVASYFGYDTSSLTPGFYPNGITADFAGGAGYAPSSGFADLTVNNRPASKIVISPASLDLGNTAGGSTAHGMVTITNSGNATYHFGAATATGDFSASTGNCASALPPGNSCYVYVDFRPTQPGTRSGTLTVVGDDPTSPDTAGLSGFGVMPIAKLSPNALIYRAQKAGTSSVAQSAIVTNTGNAPLTLASVAIVGANPSDFRLASNGCTASLSVGASCTIKLSFAPSTYGTRSATLQLTDNSPDAIQNVSLSGTGIAPSLSASPVSIDFGAVRVGQRGTDIKLSLTNNGNASLQAGSVAITGANPKDFWISGSQCPTSLAPGASCTITISFRPSASGARSAILRITTNGVPTVVSVALSGLGTKS